MTTLSEINREHAARIVSTLSLTDYTIYLTSLRFSNIKLSMQNVYAPILSVYFTHAVIVLKKEPQRPAI